MQNPRTQSDANLIDAIRSPALFRPWFKDLTTWHAWLTFIRALFALEMSAADLATFTACTGRAEAPTEPMREAWLCIGRRGGKSLVLAAIAVFLAVFRDWSDYIVPGESVAVLVIATDRKQARIIYRYARSMMTRIAVLKPLVAREDGDVIELTNGLNIEVATASFRSVRGYTLVACLLDEIAYWRNEETSANPDTEILGALRPAMSTIPNSLLLAASSPYAKRGALYNMFRRYYAQPGPVLVWKAPTKTMNPSFPQSVIEAAYEHDAAAAAAEYGAEFRSDIETFVSREVVDAATPLDRRELPPMSGANYVAFVDPSGGSADSMTLAIAHRLPDDRAALDAVREVRPPFSPESVTKEFAALLARYSISEVEGDRYAGEWPRERFREHGISYVCAEKPKSDIYRELLPALNSGKIELLDVRVLQAQLCSLERRTARGGRDSIDHPPGAHDDLANAAAGALVRAVSGMDFRAIWEKL
ncbi:MAG: hypothetical protein HIU82_12525 [Proteobacteria bacterium]|nr:hypothetical protein [Pseudomonadota bacterium]